MCKKLIIFFGVIFFIFPTLCEAGFPIKFSRKVSFYKCVPNKKFETLVKGAKQIWEGGKGQFSSYVLWERKDKTWLLSDGSPSPQVINFKDNTCFYTGLYSSGENGSELSYYLERNGMSSLDFSDIWKKKERPICGPRMTILREINSFFDNLVKTWHGWVLTKKGPIIYELYVCENKSGWALITWDPNSDLFWESCLAEWRIFRK